MAQQPITDHTNAYVGYVTGSVVTPAEVSLTPCLIIPHERAKTPINSLGWWLARQFPVYKIAHRIADYKMLKRKKYGVQSRKSELARIKHLRMKELRTGGL